MNPTRDYIEKQKAACLDVWFNNHKASILGTVTASDAIIGWQNPDSWNYGCRFIIHRRWLIVVGDIGEAVYEWGQDITLPFLAGLDFHYFHGKCQASEVGRQFNSWEGEFCVPRLVEFLKDDNRTDKAAIIEEAAGFTSSEQEWTDFLYQSIYNLGDDDYTLADAGSVPHPRVIGHFVGLQMAIAQLTEAKP